MEINFSKKIDYGGHEGKTRSTTKLDTPLPSAPSVVDLFYHRVHGVPRSKDYCPPPNIPNHAQTYKWHYSAPLVRDYKICKNTPKGYVLSRQNGW
jgi:hypothetical protein